MADFEKFYPGLMRAEGEYVHDPDDDGGETYKGIARVYNGKWPGWVIIDRAKKRLGLVFINGRVQRMDYPTLSKTLRTEIGLAQKVYAFYKGAYWDSLSLDLVKNQSIAEQMADHGVNAGTGRVGWLIQFAIRSLGVTELKLDGKIGQNTLLAINHTDALDLFNALSNLRISFYRYRAGSTIEVFTKAQIGLFEQVELYPNTKKAKYLTSWLSRVRAIKFVA